jgi:hypothetical protein
MSIRQISRNLKNNRIFRIIPFFIIGIISFFCRSDVNGPVWVSEYSICYVKIINNNWEVCINNISGTNILNISNYKYQDSDPSWSPNGKYIAFTHFTETSTDVNIFDLQNKSIRNLGTSNIDESGPKWLRNGEKIVYDYHEIGKPYYTYMMNPEGTEKHKIGDFQGIIYFLDDNYRYIYAPGLDSTTSQSIYFVHLTNIEMTYNEILFDSRKIGDNGAGIADFNPSENKILLIINTPLLLGNILATYDLFTGKIDTISIADPDWEYFNPVYSNDYSKIAVIEKNYKEDIDKISLITNGSKQELIRITAPREYIDYNPMSFSPHDKYLAYSKNVLNTGSTISWKSYLYVINIDSKTNIFVDLGKHPVWNPLFNE